MSTYAAKSILRFYPADSNSTDVHYSAVVLADARVYQIKSPSNEKTIFDTVESWLQSLPGSPSADALLIDQKGNNEQKEKNEKKEKQEKQKKKKYNVPTERQSRGTLLKWGRHVYYAIKTLVPALLEKEEVIEAYNDNTAIK